MADSIGAVDIPVLNEREPSRPPLHPWVARTFGLLAALSAFALAADLAPSTTDKVVVGLVGAVMAFVAAGWRLRWHFSRVNHPGTSAFRPAARAALAVAADADIQRFSQISFPPYQPTSAGGRLGRLDLGHASLVLRSSIATRLQRFIRQGSTHATPEALSNTAVVTGEPGSGKSVLLLELHQALWRGVLAGDHCVVPLILKATEIRSSDFGHAAVGHAVTEMPALLLHHYRRAAAQNPRLNILVTLIEAHWHSSPLMILVDGLDELPDRHEYQRVQGYCAR